MSIQPVLSHQRTPDVSTPRRRTEGGDGDAFALPGQPEGASAGADKAAAGKAAAIDAALATAAEGPVSAGATTANAKDESALKPGDVATKPTATKPAAPPPETAVQAGSTGFLTAMATAQGEAAGVQGDDGTSSPGSTSKKDEAKAGEQDGEADGASPPPGADQAKAAAEPPYPVLMPVLPLPAAGGSKSSPAAAGTANAAGGEAKGPMLPGAIAGLAKLGTPNLETADSDASGEAAAGVQSKFVLGAGHVGESKVAGEKPAAAAGAKADGTVAAAADPKALDGLQQALGPLDLSAMLQQASGKAGPDRLVQPFDPNALPNGAAASQAPGTPGGQPTPIHVVPVEIGLRAMSGSKQFDIRLDPDELGRVDVNLSISDTGEVSARLVVDRVETLHLLQRDARTLERAFEQAGLKPSDGGVDISLRDPGDQSFRQNRQHEEATHRPRLPQGPERADETSLSTDTAPQRRIVRLGGVDLSV